MMDMMVKPSIHPLALTNWEGGNNSVRDAVLGWRIGRRAQTDDGIRSQRMRAK